MKKLKFKNLYRTLLDYIIPNKSDFDVDLLGLGSSITINNRYKYLEIKISPNHPEYDRIYPREIYYKMTAPTKGVEDFLTGLGMNLIDPTTDLFDEYYDFLVTLFGTNYITKDEMSITLTLPKLYNITKPTTINNLLTTSSLELFLATYFEGTVLKIDFVIPKTKLDDMLEAYKEEIPLGDNNRLELTHDDVFVKLK